jgi:hypothetical protein
VTELPDGETDKSLEDKHHALLNLFSTDGPLPSNVAKVDILMEATYISQRTTINSDPPKRISNIKEEWPYLFTPRCILNHFGVLVGVDIVSTMQEAVNKKGATIIRFMELSTKQAEIQAVVDTYRNRSQQDPKHDALTPAVIQVLQVYFREEEKSMFLLADVSIFGLVISLSVFQCNEVLSRPQKTTRCLSSALQCSFTVFSHCTYERAPVTSIQRLG